MMGIIVMVATTQARLKQALMEKVAAGKAGVIGSALAKAKKFVVKNTSPRVRRLAGNMALLAGAAGILSAGGTVASRALDATGDPIKRGVFRKKMMKRYPKLKTEDPKAVKSVFNTLYRFSPEMASDPGVAGAFVQKGLEFKDVGIQPTDVKILSDIQSAVTNRKSRRAVKSMFAPGDLSSMHTIANPIG